MRGRAIRYSDAEMAWLATNRMMVLGDYHREFVARFQREDVKIVHLNALRKRMGWKVDRQAPGRYVGRQVDRRYSPEELAFIEYRQAMSRTELHAVFVAEFNRTDVSMDDIKALCTRKGWKTGRDGRFEKGRTPENKGKPCPPGKGGRHPNARKTQFKKGNRTGRANHIYKPIGSERFSKEGYLERKIHDGLPLQSRWQAVHKIRWEEENGPVPDGMVLKCISGDRLDTAPSNWEPVPRGLLPRLNGKHGRDYDHAPSELKPAIMAAAKLEHRVSEVRSRKKG
jgi:hypothetical protein